VRRIVVDRDRVAAALEAAGGRTVRASPGVDSRVEEIITSVRERGDAAVAELTRELDGREPRHGLSYEIPGSEIHAAVARLAAPVRASLESAAARIRAFHGCQIERSVSAEGGALELRVAALSRVGLYVPGGTALYPSSVLMTAIPANVAGVPEIIMVTPGASAETLAAARLAGVNRVFQLGGAQAIAALAFGTESVPRVDKIVGPGNQWVASAKRQVYGAVDIDSIAGPSEILIIADANANAEWIAADLLAQAEHDIEARPILVTTSEALADAVAAAVSEQLHDLPRRDIASASIEKHGIAFICPDLETCVHLANDHAPEHLEIMTESPETLADGLHTAGAIFVGGYSPEAAGDYLAGPNHVLPTGGAARYASPLGVYDFRKRTSVLHQSAEQLHRQRDAIARLARVEGLEAHARSVEIRFRDSSESADTDTQPFSFSDPWPLAALARDGLRNLEPYKVAHRDGIHTFLHANEMPFGLPEPIARGVREHLSQVALGRYPDPNATELRQAVGTFFGLDPERLVFGNGSDELIAQLVTTFSQPRPGQQAAVVLYPTPTFSVFRMASISAGAVPVEVPLTSEFELNGARLSASIAAHRPNLVFLARPNNPTGTLWDRGVILELARTFPDTLFVIDEAYGPYCGETMLPEIDGNLILMGTLSKIGLATARIGFVHGSAELCLWLEKSRLPYNLGGLGQAAATYLLREHSGWIKECAAKVVEERQRVALAMATHEGLRVFPSAANLLFFRVGDSSSGLASKLWNKLADRGVLVRNLDKDGPTAGCLRVTIGEASENATFLAALAESMAELG